MKRSFSFLYSLSLLVLTLPACTNDHSSQKDPAPTADKIVSLNGSITEVLCAFGMQDKLVGVDVTSNYPESVNRIEKVGFVRSLAAEKVLALSPTLIMAFTEGLKPEVKEQFGSAHVKTMLFDQEYSAEGTKAFIRALADTFSQQEKGEALINKIDTDLQDIEQFAFKPRVLFIYARGAGALMVAGNKTAPKAMIELAGGENAMNGFDDFKPLTPEALVNANPDVILMFDSGLQSLGGMNGLLSIPGIAQTKAGKNKRVIEIDGQYLAGFGPRVGEAAVFLNKQFKQVVAAK